MPCPQTEYYHRERVKLLTQLGGVCVCCGEADFDKLEFDHIEPRTWVANAFSSSARIARYKREAKRGKIQILCGSCNKRKYHRTREVTPESLSVDEIWNTEAQSA